MENQLDENLMYPVEPVFENNEDAFINDCPSGIALPELTLSGGDRTFPENIVSAESSQLISNLALLSEPLPFSLPEIESTFSQVSTCFPVHFRPRSFPDGNNVNQNSYYEGNFNLELPSVTTSCGVDLPHNVRGFAAQHAPLMTTRVTGYSPVNSQAPAWHAGPQCLMNCNNNNVNDYSPQPDVSASAFVTHDNQVNSYSIRRANKILLKGEGT